MAFKMKYKKGGFPFKESPMKIAPALIAKLAPVALDMISGEGGGAEGGGAPAKAAGADGGKQEQPKDIKKRGMDMWMKSREDKSE